MKKILIIFTLLFSAAAQAEDCGYRPKGVKIDIAGELEGLVTAWIDRVNCENALISLRIHFSNKLRTAHQIYVVDQKLNYFAGKNYHPLNNNNAQLVVDNFLSEISVPLKSREVDLETNCILLIPESYLTTLRNDNVIIRSYTWKPGTVGKRYIAFIKEIHQFANIASCNKPNA
jgi:hypothetical protein